MKGKSKWIALIILLVGLFWFSCDQIGVSSYTNPGEIFSAIPEDSPYILEIKDIHNLLEIINDNNEIHNSFLELDSYKSFFNDIILIDSLIKNNPNTDFNNFNQPILITSGTSGKDNTDYLFIAPFTSKKSSNAAIDLLNSFKIGNKEIEQQKYDGNSIFVIPIKNNINIYYSISEGLLLVSKSKFLIESSLHQLDGPDNLLTNEGFKKIQQTSGKNSLLNLYINHNYLPNYLKLFFNKDYKDDIKNLKNYSNWSELDLTLKGKELFLNGYSFTNDDDKFLDIFKNQKPVNFSIENVLPVSTSIFASYGITDVQQFKKHLRKYQSHLHIDTKVEDELSTIKRNYKIDLEELIYPLIDEEIAYVVSNIKNNNLNTNTFAVLKTKSKSVAKENLQKIIKAHSQKKSRKISSYTFDYKISEKQNYQIFEMPFPNTASLLFGNLFSGVNCNYYTFIENYIIFGYSKKSIISFIEDNRLNNNLIDDINYKKFTAQLAGKSNFYFYSALPKSTFWLANFLSKEYNDPEKYSLAFQNLHALSFQFTTSNKNGMIINDIYLRHDPVYTDKPHTVLELGLDSNIISKPTLVKNHITGKKEIFVQDKGSKIYLITHKGTVLWEKKLDEPIISEIYQIDYYKNDKFQFLFNTKSKMYLIDRKGNFVERYPIHFNSPATSGLGLCDYDNNNDYRIFIPCENKQVYLFAKEGNIIDGWKFGKSEHNVYSGIQHFLVDDKDYIVFADVNKSYILNRKGRQRVKPKTNFTISKNGKYILDKRSKAKSSRMIITGPDGTIYSVFFNNKVSNFKIRNFSEDHFFDFKDVNGDGQNDYIFVDKNKLEVYNQQGKSILDYTFESTITKKPTYYEFPGNRKKIGVVSEETNELFLINSDGSLYDGFPLFGNTLFSIGSLNRNGRFNLFVGTNNSFLLSYEVK